MSDELSKTITKPTVKELVERSGVKVEELTCYDCPLWNCCEFAWDGYNTDGDCLASK